MGAMTTRAKPHKRPSLPLGTPTRRAAMRLLDAVLRRGEALETALPAATRDLVSPPDRGLAHAIAAETLRRLLDLDALIDSATRQRLPDDAKARMALRIALRAKRGETHLFFVTDAMSLVGSDRDSFEINGRAVRRVPGGLCPKLVLADGTIAGSDLDMASAIRFGVAELELTLAEALRMASLYPARYLRLKDRGLFRPGLRMDAVHLDDGLFARATWRSGVRQVAG